MALLAFYGPGSNMGCDNPARLATQCWVRNDTKQIIAYITPDGITYQRLKPTIPLTPTPAPKGPAK